MKAGRAFLLLTGVMLVSAIAKFNDMTPDAQASLLDAAAETARTTAQSWLQSAVATVHEMTGAAAPQPPQRPSSPSRVVEGKHTEASSQRIAALTAGPAVEPPSAGNPLSTLPLKQLSITRERPIFSPTRRPPPPAAPPVAPVVVRQPVKKPPEPERPAVSLLGTIIGTEGRIGVFLESATQNVVRLHIGENHQGWVLHLIKAREVTLVKDGEQAAVLELRPPGEGAAVGGPTVLPALRTGTMPILSSENSADEQPVGRNASRAKSR
jgi:hypothetical protein